MEQLPKFKTENEDHNKVVKKVLCPIKLILHSHDFNSNLLIIYVRIYGIG